MIRLGGPIFEACDSPDTWVKAVQAAGYRAAYCPVSPGASDDEIRAYADAAAKADIVIAEVGAWSNPISPNDDARAAAVEKCKQSLALADAIGARCTVNIAGSRGDKWDGPAAADLTPDTFDMIVACVRDIIDAVKPSRSCYALETMPWMYPDSVESYVALLKAIGRTAFAVHFDPVNLVNCPQRCFANGDLIRKFVETLGPHIKSCHAKDILLHDNLTLHLDEVRPGNGSLDYTTFLREIDALPHDVPVMLEHLPSAEEYRLAAEHVRGEAAKISVAV